MKVLLSANTQSPIISNYIEPWHKSLAYIVRCTTVQMIHLLKTESHGAYYNIYDIT